MDPGLKDSKAADARRIAALARLAGAKVERGDFEALVPEGGEPLPPDVWARAEDDLPETAAAVAREFHGQARRAKKAWESARAEAEGFERSYSDVDLSGPDADEVRAELQEARGSLDALRRVARAEEARLLKLQEAQARLGEMDFEVVPELPDETERALKEASDSMAAAQSELERATVEAARCQERHTASKAYFAARDRALHDLEEAQSLPAASAAGLAAASDRVDDAEAALEGALVRTKAKANAESADAARTVARDQERLENTLRDAAAACELVISKALAPIMPEALSIVDNQLWAQHKRGTVLFHELSPGERWPMVFDVLGSVLGEGGMCAIRQEAWECMDPENKVHVAQLAKEKRLVLLTAEAELGELRAEAVS